MGDRPQKEESMKARGVLMFWIVTLCLCGLSQFIAAQRVEAGNQPRSGSCLSANSPNAVTVHAPKSDASHLSLCDGRALGGNAAQIGQGVTPVPWLVRTTQ
jgi:hypothetical protein